MSFQIEDGKGSGYRAHIDSENRLHTTSAMERMLGHRSHSDGSAFGTSTPLLTVTATGGRTLWIRNDSANSLYTITDLWVSWNGGSTNYNRPIYCGLYFGGTAPTTNITASGLGNLNKTYNTTGEGTVYYWNETSNGMTGHAAGTGAFFWTQGQGITHYQIGGAIILGLNDTISFNLQGQETGEAAVNILGYFHKIGME